MGFVGELPGMYYGIFFFFWRASSLQFHSNVSADQGKGKYFKIQAAGAAPATSVYSSEDVKRRKLIDERTQAIEKEVIRQKGRIRRSILDPLTGGILHREYGKVGRGLDGPQIFANGLVSQGHCMDGSPFVIFAVQPRQYHGVVMMMDFQTCKSFILF